jgi:hypothetical protein
MSEDASVMGVNPFVGMQRLWPEETSNNRRNAIQRFRQRSAVF